MSPKHFVPAIRAHAHATNTSGRRTQPHFTLFCRQHEASPQPSQTTAKMAFPERVSETIAKNMTKTFAIARHYRITVVLILVRQEKSARTKQHKTSYDSADARPTLTQVRRDRYPTRHHNLALWEQLILCTANLRPAPQRSVEVRKTTSG